MRAMLSPVLATAIIILANTPRHRHLTGWVAQMSLATLVFLAAGSAASSDTAYDALAHDSMFRSPTTSSQAFIFATTGSLAVGEADVDRVKRAVRGDWYDRDQQSYVAPRFEQLQDHPVRQKGRLAGPGWSWELPNWNVSWLRGLLTYAFTFILAIILLVCIAMLLTHFARSARVSERKLVNRPIELDLARAEDLPFSAEQLQGDPLTQARKLADAGSYDRAIIYLYGYFLLALDHARRIHLQKGKTNRMYLRELASRVELRRIVEQTMIQFENAFFGKHAITAEDFEPCWGELVRFHQLLQVTEPQDEAVSAELIVAEAIP